MNTQKIQTQEDLHKEIAATLRLMRIKSDLIDAIPDTQPLQKKKADEALNKVFVHYQELLKKTMIISVPEPVRNDMVVMAEHFQELDLNTFFG